MPYPFDTVLFDLDGTLTDPREGMINSYLHAVRTLGLTENSPEELTAYIGPPLHQGFSERYGLAGDKIDEAIAAYREYFSTKGLYENRIYDGIPELLAALYEAGITLCLATVKPKIFADRILGHFDLLRYFTHTSGSELGGALSTKPELVGQVLATIPPVSRDRIVMVGDREADIAGAHAHGIKCIAAGYGYGGPEEHRDADYRAETVVELKRVLLG